MAEALPEDWDMSEHPDDSRRSISVLLLGTSCQFDTYGLSTINKSLVNNLRLVDPEGKTIKITCAVVEDGGKIKEEDLNEAEKHEVNLKGAKRPRGSKRDKKPKVQWLDKYPTTYYLHLVQEQNYDFIIGHSPYLANGCLNLKGICKNNRNYPKVILMFHGFPRDENGDIDDEILMDWLTEADVVFSLGKAIDDELLPYISALDPEKRPIHKMYFPSYPLDLFVAKESTTAKLQGTQNVCMMSGEIKDLDINGLDFHLAVTATAGAAEYIRDFDGVRTKLSLLAAKGEEKTGWKESFEKVIHERNLNYTGLAFQVEAPVSTDKMKVLMRKSKFATFWYRSFRSHCSWSSCPGLQILWFGIPVGS